MINLTANFEQAEITNLNPRIEKHGKEEKVLGYDISIKCETTHEILEHLGVHEKFDYKSLLYKEDGSLRPHMINFISFERAFENQTLTIDLDLVSEQVMTFYKAKLKGFKAKPVFGGLVRLEFKAQMQPCPSEVEFLNRAILCQNVNIEVLPGDDSQASLDIE
jgi:hypothetical protein